MNKSPREMQKITLRLYADDLAVLRQAYPHSGYNRPIRSIVSKHVRKLLALTEEQRKDDSEVLTSEELEE